jgi:hypothetical protein
MYHVVLRDARCCIDGTDISSAACDCTKVIDEIEFGKVDRFMGNKANFAILICSQFRINYNDR